jgi:hypothetical protein
MIDVMQTAKHGLPNDLPMARFADRRIDCAWSACQFRVVDENGSPIFQGIR